MKKIMCLFLFSSVVFGHSSVTAQTSAPISYSAKVKDTTISGRHTGFAVRLIEDNDSQKFILLVDNPLQERLMISVKSLNGEGYAESTVQTSVRKRFDMTGAEDGEYIVSVTNGKITETKKVNLVTTTEVVRAIRMK